MIAYNKIELEKAAKQAGFVRDTFEKVLRLKEVLKYINSDAYLREHLALKGGTAIESSRYSHSLDAFLFLYQMQAEIGIISRWKSIIPCGHICLNRQNGGL